MKIRKSANLFLICGLNIPFFFQELIRAGWIRAMKIVENIKCWEKWIQFFFAFFSEVNFFSEGNSKKTKNSQSKRFCHRNPGKTGFMRAIWSAAQSTLFLFLFSLFTLLCSEWFVCVSFVSLYRCISLCVVLSARNFSIWLWVRRKTPTPWSLEQTQSKSNCIVSF